MMEPMPADLSESDREELYRRRVSEKIVEDIDRSVKRRYGWMAVVAVVATWVGGATLLSSIVQERVDNKIGEIEKEARGVVSHAILELQKHIDQAEDTAERAKKTANDADKTSTDVQKQADRAQAAADQAQKTLTELKATLKEMGDTASDLDKRQGDLSHKTDDNKRSVDTLRGQLAVAKQQLLDMVAKINKSSVNPNPAVTQDIQTIRARDQWIAQHFLPTYENPCIGPGCYEVVVSEWTSKEKADTARTTLEATYPEIGSRVWQSGGDWAVVIAMGVTQSEAQRLKQNYQGKLHVDYHDRGDFSVK